jgi:tRNA(Arg) A34 adenosine deaminase TadA
VQTIIKATIKDKRGVVLSVATNSYIKTHPRQAELAAKVGQPYRMCLHAEVLAVIRASKTGLKPHSISVERYNKIGQPMLAKPCPICQLAIKEAGIILTTYTVNL